ncbi:hypothetical protein HZC09_02600 [Candidatus Micrarchaeota archaeon]|nr:hypothetical protein [Candidatus Micrarchaeota archaeon]
MTYANITIRGLNEKTYRKARALAVEEGKNMGEVVNEALQIWLAKPVKKIKAKSFMDLFERPNDWGVKTDIAKEADEYIYR